MAMAMSAENERAPGNPGAQLHHPATEAPQSVPDRSGAEQPPISECHAPRVWPPGVLLCFMPNDDPVHGPPEPECPAPARHHEFVAAPAEAP